MDRDFVISGFTDETKTYNVAFKCSVSSMSSPKQGLSIVYDLPIIPTTILLSDFAYVPQYCIPNIIGSAVLLPSFATFDGSNEQIVIDTVAALATGAGTYPV